MKTEQHANRGDGTRRTIINFYIWFPSILRRPSPHALSLNSNKTRIAVRLRSPSRSECLKSHCDLFSHPKSLAIFKPGQGVSSQVAGKGRFWRRTADVYRRSHLSTWLARLFSGQRVHKTSDLRRLPDPTTCGGGNTPVIKRRRDLPQR